MYINPEHVLVETQSQRDVQKQKERLLAEGQIEPIVLTPDNQVCTCSECWVYAPAQVVAARELGWATILVTSHEQDKPHGEEQKRIDRAEAGEEE